MIDRPRILTSITVPTGGWTWAISVSNATNYDTAVTATIPAGTYYAANDAQANDIFHIMAELMTTAMQALGAPFASAAVRCYIDTDYKARFVYANVNAKPVKHRNSASTAGLRSVMGEVSSDVTFTTLSTPSYRHGYGWYASVDGILRARPAYDQSSVRVAQARSDGGVVKTLQLSEYLFDSAFDFYGLPLADTFSDEADYGETPSAGLSINRGLECWWREAVQGKPFRFYRQFVNTAARGQVTLKSTSETAQTVNTGLTLDVGAYDDWVLYSPDAGDGYPLRAFIEDTAVNVVTTIDAIPGIAALAATGDLFYFNDERYETYVLDVASGAKFAPQEVPSVNLYNVGFRLMRYVAP